MSSRTVEVLQPSYPAQMMPPPEAWHRALAGLLIPAWRFYARLGSTQEEARLWAQQGAADGCFVYAEHQVQGRGRQGRRWITPPGQALALSVIVRPLPQETRWLARLVGWAAVALCEVLEAYGLEPHIKWPNDVLLSGKKVAGILVEAAWQGGQLPSFAVVGIGVNVYQGAVPHRELLGFPATSLEEQGLRPERPRLLAQLVQALGRWRYRLASPRLWLAWQHRLAYRNQRVQVQMAGRWLQGTLLGLTPEGWLQIQDPQGRVHSIPTAEHLRPLEGPDAQPSTSGL